MTFQLKNSMQWSFLIIFFPFKNSNIDRLTNTNLRLNYKLKCTNNHLKGYSRGRRGGGGY